MKNRNPRDISGHSQPKTLIGIETRQYNVESSDWQRHSQPKTLIGIETSGAPDAWSSSSSGHSQPKTLIGIETAYTAARATPGGVTLNPKPL